MLARESLKDVPACAWMEAGWLMHGEQELGACMHEEGIFIVQGELRGARRTREAICMVINVKAVWSPNSNNLQGNKLYTISTIVQD
jgi:hypothetical protein